MDKMEDCKLSVHAGLILPIPKDALAISQILPKNPIGEICNLLSYTFIRSVISCCGILPMLPRL